MKLNSVSAICISIMLLLSSLMLVTGAGSGYAQATGPAKYFAIYYTVTSNDIQKIYAGGNVYYLKQGHGLTMCYIPDLNSTTYVEGSEYDSPTWAPTAIIPYTVDDRLFLFYEEPPNPDISSEIGTETTYCWEVNPANCTTQTPTLGYGRGMPFNFYCWGNFAVVDNSLYFVEGSWFDMFYSAWVGNDLRVVNLTSGAEKQLLKTRSNDPDNYGNLVSAGGNLFRYDFSDGTFTINQIDLGTGKIAKGVQLFMPASPQPSTNAAYRDWSFSADENTFYIAAAYSPGPDTNYTQIWLCTIPLTEFENNSIPNGPDSATGPDYWFNVNPVVLPLNASFRLWGTDACEGVVLLKIANAFIILYDSNTQNYVTIPGKKDNACILYGATNPETIASSSPSPSPTIPEMTPLFAAAALIVATCAITIFIKKKTQSRLTPYFKT